MELQQSSGEFCGNANEGNRDDEIPTLEGGQEAPEHQSRHLWMIRSGTLDSLCLVVKGMSVTAIRVAASLIIIALTFWLCADLNPPWNTSLPVLIAVALGILQSPKSRRTKKHDRAHKQG